MTTEVGVLPPSPYDSCHHHRIICSTNCCVEAYFNTTVGAVYYKYFVLVRNCYVNNVYD